MTDEWSQLEMFPEPSATWLQVGICFNQEADTLQLYWKVMRRQWPYQLGEGNAFFNFTDNGLRGALERVYETAKRHTESTGLILGEIEYVRGGAPF